MTEVISVRFKDAGKAYYFDPKGEKFTKGENVIVETSRGLVYGEVTTANQMVPDESVVAPLRQVERRATPNDRRHYEENCKKEKEALKICEQKVIERNLDMKLVDVEYAFEGGKILFYFTSDGRVDFRELVKDLAAVFHTRIELRQIGVRDEAKMLGGLGICGQPFCCSRFLNDFHPVSIKMAKEQGLSLNPVKISGTCGRLMCCLNYEQNVYDELLKITPKVGATVKTPQGVGTVMSVSLLEQRVKVRFEENAAPIIFDCCDVKSMHRGAPKKAENDSDQSQDSAIEDN
ncbi:MAG: stage 0 sporulation family protein [Clostridia bacterium]|nr:stage 0 sporulation family protein [Clostridia bacterium]